MSQLNKLSKNDLNLSANSLAEKKKLEKASFFEQEIKKQKDITVENKEKIAKDYEIKKKEMEIRRLEREVSQKEAEAKEAAAAESRARLAEKKKQFEAK